VNPLQQSANVVFLALVVWREARGEGDLARLGVAFTIINRAHNPAWWGNDIQSVIFKKWQFSSMTAPNDPQLATWPATDDPDWMRCLELASMALSGTAVDPVKDADSYFDDSIAPPAWATPDKFVAKLGRLNFYAVNHDHEGNP